MHHPHARFQVGLLVATPGALALLDRHKATAFPPGPRRTGVDPPGRLLARHVAGDFGDLDREDIAANHAEIAAFIHKGEPGRALSRYTLRGERLWIITYFVPLVPHRDRIGSTQPSSAQNQTTLLLPEDQ